LSTTALLVVFGVVTVVFALAIAGLAIGVMTTGRCLRGSCGGPDLRAADGLSLRCMLCPNRRRAGDRPADRAEADS
jgi:hypothetical protein